MTRRVAAKIWPRGEPRPQSGTLANISATGAFVLVADPPRSGTRVRLEVLDPDHGFVVEGEVVRSHRVVPQLRKVRPSGIGMRFFSPAELTAPLLAPEGEGRAAAGGTYAVHFEDAEAFLESFRRDMSQGGLFVPTPHPAPLRREVTVEIHPPGGDSVCLAARVVQHVGGGHPGVPAAGMGVELVDPPAALEKLRPAVLRLDGGTAGPR